VTKEGLRRILGVVGVAALSAATASVASAQNAKWHADSASLTTPSGTIYGTALIPDGTATFPFVVIISGSGPTDRNGNSLALPGPNNSLLQLAEGLAARGIGSVRYDKRGVAASAKAATSESELRFEMYADDAAAWVRKFRGEPRVASITVAGHSEGALLGILAAERARADGYVSISGIARAADAVLTDQFETALPKPMADDAIKLVKQLAAGSTVPVPVNPPLASLFRASVQPYMISWFKWNPALEIAKLTVPVLIVQGTTDIQVKVAEAEALKVAQPKARLVKIEGMNHVLKSVGSDQNAQLASYGDPKLKIVPELVESVAKFVLEIRIAK
jgi:pimeloyl-ACP methyl ester carboxylesterase